METAREDRKFRQQLAALQRQEAQQSKKVQAEREREEQAKKVRLSPQGVKDFQALSFPFIHR